MAATWTIVPIPRWYFADNFGRPAGGGKLYTSYAINPSLSRAVASNPAGTTFYTNPILFDANGESPGPLFWEEDGTGTDQGYFLRMTDADGNTLWTMTNYGPGIAGGGGGSIITSGLSLDNLLVNGVFWRNAGTITGATTIANNTVLAPGAHDGFGGGTVLTDITYQRGASTCTDVISFPEFFPATPFAASDDVTPVYAFNYSCSVNPGGESLKRVYFPVTGNVQNLQDMDVTITLWGQAVGAANTVEIGWYQNMGDGPSATSLDTPITAIVLPASPTWEKTVLAATVPDASILTPGECGNGALYLYIDLPINTTCDVSFTKLCLYLGDNAPAGEFETFDHIASVTSAPRTGDVRMSFNAFAPFGWVLCNDGSIGDAGTGATARANIDTFPLFDLIYQNVSDTYAPVSGGRTGNAVNDFVAGKTLTLSKTLGRALASAGTPSSGGTAWALGQFTGSETHTMVEAELAPHVHGPLAPTNRYVMARAGSGNLDIAAGTNFQNADTTESAGSGTPFSIMQPTTFLNVFLKL